MGEARTGKPKKAQRTRLSLPFDAARARPRARWGGPGGWRGAEVCGPVRPRHQPDI